MRRTVSLCVFFFLAAVMLGGCTAQQRAPAPAAHFAADFSARYRGMSLSGRASVGGQGSVDISLSSPESLGGICAVYRGNELRLTLGGLQCTADEAYLPNGAFFSEMKQILTGVESIGSDGTAALPSGECRYTVDEQGFVCAAEADGLSVAFQNHQRLD